MKRILLLTTTSVLFCVAMLQAQNVFNPADSVARWRNTFPLGHVNNPNPNIAGLQKWVAVASNGISTGNGNWDNSSFKPYFVNIGGRQMCFRLKFPKSYTNPDSAGKKYPLMLFFHGLGEPGCANNGGIYNNERQLTHGGKLFRDRVDNGSFDGFLFYPQNLGTGSSSCSGPWGVAGYSSYYDLVAHVVDSLVKYVRTDQDRIFVNGLSAGGAATWSLTAYNPKMVAGAAPSAAATGSNNFDDFVSIPIWFTSGGKDINPSPGFSQGVYNALRQIGGDVRFDLYADLGHSVWDRHWKEPGYVEFMNSAHKANPLIFFQRNEFCPDSPINVKLGITKGFYAYEWEKDGALIASYTNKTKTIHNAAPVVNYHDSGNVITIRSFGVYKVRFKRTANGPWSVWSPKPAVISSKPVTQTPLPQVNGMRSNVLPAPDGSTTVPLILPAGYVSYQWFQGATVVATQNTYNAAAGNYTAKVVEQFGCGAQPSGTYTVVNANGNPKPEPAKNLSAAAVSLTSIQLDWSDNPHAGENETGFEIYRAAQAGGPYHLITITAPNAITYTNTGLTSNTQYYYIVRAIGASGAAVVSNEAAAKTAIDATGPTAPSSFRVLSTFTNYANVSWVASTDDVGVDKYDIFINGTKTYTTTQTSFTISNLDSGKVYSIYVKARDAAGNFSAPSNQLTISTGLNVNGLNYRYYEGTWTNLPNFNAITAVKAGNSANLDLTVRNRETNFGVLWEGYINVPTTANYTFELCSDDGSRLYIDQSYAFGNTPLINHDGTHSSNCKTASVTLTAGLHPIAVAYFNATGGMGITLSWQNNAGMAKTVIPSSAYFSPGQIPPALAGPTNLVATGVAHNKIHLTWSDNSTNEAGFEVLRATSAAGPFSQAETVTGSSYTDSGLLANTKYFYKVRAIGIDGESIYNGNFTEANWKVNNSQADANGNAARTLVSNSGTPYTTTGVKEGSHALILNGTSHHATVSGSSSGGFPSDGGYSQRTVAMWIKPTAITNKKVVFDFGNNVNGLALRFNGGVLQAGISSGTSSGNAVRGVATASQAAFNANWVSGDWNHVAVVYNVNSLKVFLNGVEIAANTSLGFNSIAAASANNSRIGYSGGSGGDVAFNESAGNSDYLGGLVDDIYVIGSALSASELARLMNSTYGASHATTLPTPAAPAAPTALAGIAVSGSKVNLTWTDNATDETGYELYRSTTNNSNYRLVATLPAGTTAFSDTTLFANVTYFFKVRATGIAAPSAYSDELSVVTPNTIPAFVEFNDFTMRYGTTHTFTLTANDPDGDQLTFTAGSKPYFVTLQPNSKTSVNVVSKPKIADQGSYAITIYVTDPFGGKDTIVYNMEVNSNSLPVVPAIADISMSEGETRKLALVATDAEDVSALVWTAIEKPSFATLVDSGNGRASLTLAPNLIQGGSYPVILKADDGYGGFVTKNFMVSVAEKNPNETFQVNMKYFTGGVARWNDVETYNGTINKTNLVNTKGVVTTAGINLHSGIFGSTNAGVLGGGVFPDNVMKDNIFWGFYWQNGSTDTLRLRVHGLDETKKYNFIFMASNNCTGCGLNANTTTTYKIGNETAAIKYFNNATVTDTIYQVQPATGGEVIITMIGDAANGVGGVLTALVIDARYDDGTTPAKPTNLAAEAVAGTGVKLTWTDYAYNEYDYKVYRAAAQAGPYTLLTTLEDGATTYTDANVSPYTQYYYYVVGTNNYGVGASSDSVGITTANNKPVIAGLVTNIGLKADANNQDDFTVTDTPGDVVTVTLVNQPGFVSLQALGGNNYRLVAAPTASDLGNYTFTVKAADDKGGVATTDVTISVTDKNTRSVYLNIGYHGDEAPAPWNNYIGYGNAGTTLPNLKDENNVTTSIGFQLVGGWQGITEMGHMTGNNTGVYPDKVLRSGIWDNKPEAREIRFTGLDNSKRYNVVIFGTQNDGTEAISVLTTTGASDTLNARYNTNETGNLNNLTPVNGVISINMTKPASSPYQFLSAVQLEEITPGTVLSPVNLYVEPRDRNSATLSWSDRTSNEDAVGGFEVQRSTSADFSGAVTVALTSNRTTYTSTGLTPNTKYWYRVRAKVGGVYTDWSNVVKTITPGIISYVNLNFATEYNAPAPWFNLEAMPFAGLEFENLPNQSNQPTGISLSIEKEMNGDNNFGVFTGNNSGIVPDVVLQSNYWIDNTQLAQMKLKGLNQAKRYRIGFLGSMSDNGWRAGDYTATYTINGRTVYLNSWNNADKIVYIGDVQADANGELLLDFSTTDAAAYGFNGGLVIQSYDDVPEGGTVLNRSTANQTVGTTAGADAARAATQVAGQEIGEGKVYPNPFIDQVNIDFNNTAADNHVTVDVYDLSGKLVFRKAFGRLSAGYNTLRINTGDAKLNTGIYMVTLSVNGKPVQVNKLVKTNQ